MIWSGSAIGAKFGLLLHGISLVLSSDFSTEGSAT